MKRIAVRHRSGEYAVSISKGILADVELFAAIRSRPVAIVTDRNVAPLWLPTLQRSLPMAETLVLPPGEREKTVDGASRIWQFLAENDFGRDTVLIAFGGGVIGDMTGFAAACWMRGVDFIQVPTTLLAQVDASIGGKTGVDLHAGKNLVGAFHQPLAVYIDPIVLRTLPPRQYAGSVAEIIKVALIADTAFFEWLELNAVALREREPDTLEHAIQRSCEIKANIVMEDEREQARRAVLNLGHTFAHALETVTSYRQFLHGEAVGIGLTLAAALSEGHCGLDTALRPRLDALLQVFGLPTRLPGDISRDALLHAMQLDKKHIHSHWRLVLLEAPGRAVVHAFENPDAIRKVLDAG